GNQHHAVIQLVRNYKEDLEDFGRVAFEMRPFHTEGGIQKREVALLNEHQATLLLTYMKNTESIRNSIKTAAV
ncbi:MAG: Rha family transcriptional regulator, partial [Desulfobacteraceae bacterium]